MSPEIRTIKQLAAKLSADDLNHLVGWCYRLAEEKELEARSDPSKGIPPTSLLRAFRRTVPMSGGRVMLVNASLAASALADFYEKVRVRGCRQADDSDMLLVEWGVHNKEPFLSFTRQVIPDKAQREVWQLKLHYRYRACDAPKGLIPGNRWCRSLKQLDAFTGFLLTSRAVSHLSKKPHTGVSLTYENVE